MSDEVKNGLCRSTFKRIFAVAPVSMNQPHVQFFTVLQLLWIAQMAKDFLGGVLRRVRELMANAMGTIQFCPLLAILFVGTRMCAWVSYS